MNTVHHNASTVQNERDPDAAWWAGRLDEEDVDAPPTEPHANRVWLNQEAAGLEARAAKESDPTGHLRLAAFELRSAATTLWFHGFDDARAFLADPTTVPGPGVVVHLPTVGSRRSPLAAALDVLTAWYVHLDTAAATLAAWRIASLADAAEEFVAEDAGDYFENEAALWMAASDVLEGAALDCFL